LNEGNFRHTEASLVGDVVGGVNGLGVLTVDTSDLNIVLVSNGLEFGHVLGELGESDVNGSSEGSTEVSGARGDVTKVLVVGELGNLLNSVGGAGESVEDGVDVSTVLHGDDSELILFVNPNKEGLVVVMEDTSTRRPVSVEVAGLKETVTFLEEEVIINKLFLNGTVHAFKRVEGTLKVTFEVVASLNDSVHDFKSLFLGNTRSKRISVKVSTNSNSSRLDHLGILFTEGRGNEIS